MIRGFFATVLLLGLFTISCKPDRKTARNFYYWKSTFRLSPVEEVALKSSADSLIYIRFFDVEWDTFRKTARPVSPLQCEEPVPSYANVCPVVFIKNEVFENSKRDSLKLLASHIYQLVQQISQQCAKPVNSIQIDCDWTLRTREPYFTFLNLFKDLTKLKLQATIRLHQVKYSAQTGIPPVDEGVLMYYNMSALNAGHVNSIYDRHQARLYLPALRKYPLPLVYALPIFSWAVAHNGHKVMALLNKTNRTQLESDPHLLQTDENSFTVKQSFFRNGYYLKEGWILKLEDVTPEQIGEMKTDLDMYAPQPPRRYIYFDLDSLNLQTHEHL